MDPVDGENIAAESAEPFEAKTREQQGVRLWSDARGRLHGHDQR